MIPIELRDRWEAAYRLYAHASDPGAQQGVDVVTVARAMASASWEVAHAWRDIAEYGGNLPWWVAAALNTAAEAYEHQARAWHGRAEGDPRPPVGRGRPGPYGGAR